MNEELYRDMCLMLAPYIRTSAKRLLSGSITSGEFETIASIIATYYTDGMKGININDMQYCRLSVTELSYYVLEQEIPWDEFLDELNLRHLYDNFMRTTYLDICRDLSNILGIDSFQLAHGNVTEHQKMSIRLALGQLDGYQAGETELFLNELKKRKDNQ